MPRKSVEDICNEFLDAKAKDGLTDVYLKNLKTLTAKFAHSFSVQF